MGVESEHAAEKARCWPIGPLLLIRRCGTIITGGEPEDPALPVFTRRHQSSQAPSPQATASWTGHETIGGDLDYTRPLNLNPAIPWPPTWRSV